MMRYRPSYAYQATASERGAASFKSITWSIVLRTRAQHAKADLQRCGIMKRKTLKCRQCHKIKPYTVEFWVSSEDGGMQLQPLHVYNCRECVETNIIELNKTPPTQQAYMKGEAAHKRIGKKQHTPLPEDRKRKHDPRY